MVEKGNLTNTTSKGANTQMTAGQQAMMSYVLFKHWNRKKLEGTQDLTE